MDLVPLVTLLHSGPSLNPHPGSQGDWKSPIRDPGEEEAPAEKGRPQVPASFSVTAVIKAPSSLPCGAPKPSLFLNNLESSQLGIQGPAS